MMYLSLCNHSVAESDSDSVLSDSKLIYAIKQYITLVSVVSGYFGESFYGLDYWLVLFYSILHRVIQ